MSVELKDAGEQQGVTPAGDGIGTAEEVPLFGRKKRLKGRPKRCGGAAAAAAAWGSAGRWARQSRLAAAFRPIRATTEGKLQSRQSTLYITTG